MQINIDVSRRYLIRSASVDYVMRDYHAKIIMTKSKQIRDCLILLAEVWSSLSNYVHDPNASSKNYHS